MGRPQKKNCGKCKNYIEDSKDSGHCSKIKIVGNNFIVKKDMVIDICKFYERKK